MRTLTLVFLSISLIFIGCSNGRGDQTPAVENKPAEKPIQLVRIDAPVNGTTLTVGEVIKLDIKLLDSNVQPDSLILYINDSRVDQLQAYNYSIPTKGYSLGTLEIKTTAWKNGKHQSASVNVMLKTNIVPKKYTYRVIKTFNHDPQAYTQGLYVNNGYLYEGTGQNGSSSLRKVELETGKVLQSTNLNQEYFGEGIALFDGKIYQLTWTSGIGFVYDAETFNKLHSFNYATQGWGLTTNGKELIMSDGSNTLYFMEPNGFTEVKKIEVFDNYGPQKMLNELEYIDGKIWANVYTSNRVVIIDPQSGAVVSEIDFSGILKNSDKTGNEDVLNGIAYDSTNKRIYVTGKNWPKLFQIEIVSK
jgi:glutamine cyclotransferase